jgi:arabinofuranan 3-O-arabinosyltransferase
VSVVRREAPALLVVHENANAGWRATLSGHSLRAVVVDGWQQAFVVPAGAAARVSLTYAPDRTYRLGLLMGLLAALLLVGLALLPARRAEPLPRVAEARIAPIGRALLVAVALLMLGGWTGLCVAVAAVGIGLLPPRRRRLVAGSLVAVSAAVAGGLLALEPWPGNERYAGDWWPTQLAVLIAVGAMAAVWLDTRQAGTRRFWRRKRRSTSE